MTNVVTRKMPHKVGSASITNPELKFIVMQFMENFISLGNQLAETQKAVRELQNGLKVTSRQ